MEHLLILCSTAKNDTSAPVGSRMHTCAAQVSVLNGCLDLISAVRLHSGGTCFTRVVLLSLQNGCKVKRAFKNKIFNNNNNRTIRKRKKDLVLFRPLNKASFVKTGLAGSDPVIRGSYRVL